MAHNFEYYTPTRIIFGRNTEDKVADLIKRYGGSRVLLHYGGQSAIKSGLIDRVKKSLDDAGLFHVELGGVVPNPQLSKVRTGVGLGNLNQIDFVLAVGGGSVIDSSKAIACALAELEVFDVWDLYDHKRKPTACLPIGVILTIAAAGSEMSDSSVITNDETNTKRGCHSSLFRPKFAIMNPELTFTLPDYQTACGCVDIMMHTMERYFTNGGNMEITDNIAEGLMRTVMRHAKILVTDPINYESRAEIMWASSLSHNGLTGCGNGGNDFASHSLEHELSGMFGVAHGAGLAAIWGSWARYVYKDCLPRFKKFALNVMQVEDAGSDEEIALKGIEAVENFYREIKMPTSLKELGIEPTDSQLVEMAHRCAVAVGGSRGSAKKLFEEDMLKIYQSANGIN
ncbi:MAG: iron-containing alcohol dehydrogenase [Selenomonadaceae bacterium]|nr:iron-containing alcohol dehydrogenase [Selenomonadaceae bacterium]